MLFKQLYADNVLGRVTNEPLCAFSPDYHTKQKVLFASVPADELPLEKLNTSVVNMNACMQRLRVILPWTN